MSDSNKFGGTGAALAEDPVQESAPEPSAGSGPKPILLVAIVAGVLVLALAAYFLLFSGGSDSTATSGAVPKGSVSAPAGGSTAPTAKASAVTSTAPSTVSGSAARDPFAPLVVAGAPSSSAASTTAASTGTGTTTTATTVPAGVTEVVTVNKLGSSPASADVTINGVKYTGVKEGVVFAKYFSLAYTSGNAATFHFGDTVLPPLAVGKTTTFRT
jgi:hypothetical protein